MKKILLVLVLLSGFTSQVKAQEANKFRFDIRLGYAKPSNNSGSGLLLNLEPKWTITNRMNVGLRFGIAIYTHGLENGGVTQGSGDTIGASFSYAATYDYYFHNTGSDFSPFIGGGLGYYTVTNVLVDDTNLTEDSYITSNGKFGGMIRAGFDWGKFRLAAEYNLIGKSDLRDVKNIVIGTSKNGYIGISLGAYFGGGKWARQSSL